MGRMRIGRRDFMLHTAAGTVAGTMAGEGAVEAEVGTEDGAEPGCMNFCGHEHWGSIAGVGCVDEGYRADVWRGAEVDGGRGAGVLDLVLDPYGLGWLVAGGNDPNEAAKAKGHGDVFDWWRQEPRAAFEAIRPLLARHRLTGVFRCTARGIRALHGVDIETLDADAWMEAEGRIRAAYGNLHAWHVEAMGKAGFSRVVRAVHPEFYYREASAAGAAAEGRYLKTVLRIDPLLSMWKRECPQREQLASWVGVEPGDAGSWREFLERLFVRAADGGAVGIKQLQAYHRPLEFRPEKDAVVKFRGALSRGEERRFQDWVVHACCALADARGWPHQCHVGTNNLGESSPLPLESLARRYGNMKLVLLHCWPFVEEAGYLAKLAPNVYVDSCWQTVLNPAFFEDALRAWLGYVPAHKMLCSHDATSVEMAAGSATFVRSLLRKSLAGCGGADEIEAALLHDNAAGLHGGDGMV